jgi:N6-L-threonylcarbamoyladenine synthase
LKPAGARHRFDFSFSGIKTAVAVHLRDGAPDAAAHPDIAASFQEAVVDMLLAPAFAAVEACAATRLVIAGGVSANSRLRQRAAAGGAKAGVDVILPAPRYCTDNAAMIGVAAHYRLARGERDDWTLNAAAVADLAAASGRDGRP